MAIGGSSRSRAHRGVRGRQDDDDALSGGTAAGRAPLAIHGEAGRYLAFIHRYTVLHGVPPAEHEMQHFFQVSPPTVRQMILTLEKKGLVRRTPGMARSIKVLVPAEQLARLI